MNLEQRAEIERLTAEHANALMDTVRAKAREHDAYWALINRIDKFVTDSYEQGRAEVLDSLPDPDAGPMPEWLANGEAMTQIKRAIDILAPVPSVPTGTPVSCTSENCLCTPLACEDALPVVSVPQCSPLVACSCCICLAVEQRAQDEASSAST